MKNVVSFLVALVVVAGAAVVTSTGSVSVAAPASVPTQQVVFAVPTNFSVSSSTLQVVATGKSAPPVTFVTQCMADVGLSGVVAVNTSVAINSNPPATLAQTVGPLAPGMRLVNLTLINTCTENSVTYRVYSADVANPTPLGAALVAAPAGITLLSGDEAVIKGDEDGTGVADAVCVQPGSPAVHTELWSDIPLLRGDRLVDFQFLFYDPATGETYYDAYLEY